jgi:hypothetical protein
MNNYYTRTDNENSMPLVPVTQPQQAISGSPVSQMVSMMAFSLIMRMMLNELPHLMATMATTQQVTAAHGISRTAKAFLESIQTAKTNGSVLLSAIEREASLYNPGSAESRALLDYHEELQETLGNLNAPENKATEIRKDFVWWQRRQESCCSGER